MTPRYFHDDVKRDQVVTRVKHTNVALAATDVHELNGALVLASLQNKCTYVAKQFLHNISLARDCSGLDGIAEELVLLGKGN